MTLRKIDENMIDDKFTKKVSDLKGKSDELADALAEKANQRDLSLLSYEKYGEIVFPDDFRHDLDFKIWRDTDGKVKHNFEFDNRFTGYSTFYVSEAGSDAKDGLTPSTAWQTLTHTFATIEANVNINSAKIIVVDILSRNTSTLKTTITKNYLIDADTEKYIGGYEGGLTWTLHSEGVYKATEHVPEMVFDSRFLGQFGLPAKYDKKGTMADCQAKKGSWYTDGTLTYVHRLDNSVPINSEVFVVIAAGNFDITYGTDCTFAIRNITFLCGATIQYGYFHSDSMTQGKLLVDNVKLLKRGGEVSSTANGFFINNLKSAWLLNTISKDAHADGFNYHATLGGNSFVFEYECISMDCGLLSGISNNNCTTAHDGIHVLRVGSKGINAKGPVLADANGCYTIGIDCTMADSKASSYLATKASYYFDDSPTASNPNPNGKAILINSSGGNTETLGFNCDESFKAKKITIDNFNGCNIPKDINFNII